MYLRVQENSMIINNCYLIKLKNKAKDCNELICISEMFRMNVRNVEDENPWILTYGIGTEKIGECMNLGMCDRYHF